MKTMRENTTSSAVSIRLTGLPAALREEGFLPLHYRLLREAAINAVIPAFQINGMWHFHRGDTEEIAKALKLGRPVKPGQIVAPPATETAHARSRIGGVKIPSQAASAR